MTPEAIAVWLTRNPDFFEKHPDILAELQVPAPRQEGTIPLIPGISTVSELMLGMQYGLKEFKFFPAEANGGVKALQAIGGPFAHIRFCPTGGISPANYRDYLALNSVLCIGGSWLVPADALEAGDYDRITTLAREAVEGAK